jgi:hypothetical protein
VRNSHDPRSSAHSASPSGARSDCAARDEADGGHAEAPGENGNGSVNADSAAAIASAMRHCGEIFTGMQTLLALRAERRRLAVRRWVMAGAVVVLALLALVPLILGGVSSLVAGMNQGFTVLWGDRTWLGDLTTGIVILGGVALLAWAGAARLARNELARMVAKYGDAPTGDADAER